MGEKVASLYAEISGDSTKLERSLKNVKSAFQDMARDGQKTGVSLKQMFSEVAGFVGKATGAIGGVALAFTKIMDIGKQGAMLEYTADKFDQLAQSAGTTSKVLLDDLRNAVRGTRSDMELMASAGGFMALGLAKTRDEVVRLTRVAGALNMDMNQLVLTLTNQTTMRFDALGVSVDGFEEKVKKLKDAGMSANDAFKEAFLQQAEEQIGKVGDAAESSLGKFQRMEAAFKNLGDAVKLKFVPPLSTAAETMTLLLTWGNQINTVYATQKENLVKNAKSYDEYAAGILWAAKAAGKLNDVTSLNVEHILGEDEVLRRVMFAMGEYSEATWNAMTQTTDFADRLVDGRVGLSEIEDEAKNAKDALGDLGDEADDAKVKILGLNDIDLNLADTIKRELDKIDFYLAGGLELQQVTENVKAALLAGKITPEEAEYLFDDLYIAAQALDVRLGEITADEAARNIRDTLGVSLDEAKGKVAGINAEFDKIPDEINVRLNILQSGGGIIGDLRSQGSMGGEQEHATGGSFVIPSGFTETYSLAPGHVASSGEVVTVTPIGQTPKDGIQINLYNPNFADPVDYELILYRIADEIKARSR